MNEYKKMYYDLIQYRKIQCPLQKQIGITESHHIQMASLYPKKKDDPSNIVVLTIAEHLQAHRYLYLWYKSQYSESDSRYQAAVKAYVMMLTTRDNVLLTENEAADLRAEYAKCCSLSRKGKALSEKNRQNICNTWRKLEMRKQQSERIRKAYANGDGRQKITQANIRRYQDPLERKRTGQKSKEYFQRHPEAAKKHGDDLRGRKYVYNLEMHKFKMVTVDELNKYLENGWTLGIPIYYLVKRGKHKGELLTKYICPWKIDTCCFLTAKKSVWSLQKPN